MSKDLMICRLCSKPRAVEAAWAFKCATTKMRSQLRSRKSKVEEKHFSIIQASS